MKAAAQLTAPRLKAVATSGATGLANGAAAKTGPAERRHGKESRPNGQREGDRPRGTEAGAVPMGAGGDPKQVAKRKDKGTNHRSSPPKGKLQTAAVKERLPGRHRQPDKGCRRCQPPKPGSRLQEVGGGGGPFPGKGKPGSGCKQPAERADPGGAGKQQAQPARLQQRGELPSRLLHL